MKLSEIIDLLSAQIHTIKIDRNLFVKSFRASNLLSDVLRNPMEKGILLTELINHQVIRTAEMIEIPAIVFTDNQKPSEEMVVLATENNIALLSTSYKLCKSYELLHHHSKQD